MTNESSGKKIPKPIVLIIIDGWGVNQPYAGNAVFEANTPFLDSLVSEYPSTTLRASGEAVGLPWGEAGNSEVGHLNLGLGRILYQDLPRINKEISDQSFFSNDVFLKAAEHVKKNNSCLHVMGLVSDGSVHSSVDHLNALLSFAKKQDIKDVAVHAILDGRDTPFNSGRNFIQGLERSMKEYGVGKVASLAGRFYTMDRNNNWDRVGKGYTAMVDGIGNQSESALAAIEESYKKKIYDEEFVPTVITKENKPFARISDNDVVIFFNYRPDRARQITRAFVQPDFDKFKRSKYLENLLFVCFTEYEKDLPVEIAFPPVIIKNTLGEVLSKAGLKQLRIAETEKYAHVTYFFNGGREDKSPGEDHVLVPSPAVPNYDMKPEMSAIEVTKKILNFINNESYDFILVNFANADMIGHTGNIAAAVKALEVLDDCIEKIIKIVLEKDGVAMITADHGNAEVMFNMQTGQIDKEHTANPVPFILIGNQYAGRNIGWGNVVGHDLSIVQPQGILSDVAPTVLEVFGIKKPKQMTGMSLLS
jgi:2,3-bisphosphoglycerate-independent phosphoglycerate mutase